MESYADIIDKLKTKGVKFSNGLSDREVSAIENNFDFVFPPDLRQFLHTAVPLGDAFVNWRSMQDVQRRIAFVWEGISFDIQRNLFWCSGWGEKPEKLAEQLRVAEEHFKTYPKLIPIYSHRYIPSLPTLAGNPVFSVLGTDIINYGYDLTSYLEHEFGFRSYESLFSKEHPYRKILFWSEFV